MLSLDNKTRIKIKDILNHPWVRNFEKLELERISNRNNTIYKSKSESIMNDTYDSDAEDIKKLEMELARAKLKAESKGQKKQKFDNKNYESHDPRSQIELLDRKELSIISIDSNNYLKNRISNERLKLLDTIKTEHLKALPSSNLNKDDEFAILQNNLNDQESLFDKVLTQVQSSKKNKNKNHLKSFYNTMKQIEQLELDFEKDNDRNEKCSNANFLTNLNSQLKIDSDDDTSDGNLNTFKNKFGKSKINSNAYNSNKNPRQINSSTTTRQFLNLGTYFYNKEKGNDEIVRKKTKRNNKDILEAQTTASDAKDSNKDLNNKHYRDMLDDEFNEDDFYYDLLATEISKKSNTFKVSEEYTPKHHKNTIPDVGITLSILDKAKENKYKTTIPEPKEEKPKDIWTAITNFFTPFKCDKI